MHVWLIHLGELLPTDGTPRLFRYGVLAQMLSDAGHRVTRWAPTFVHATKKYRAASDCRIDVDLNYSIELLHARGYRRHIGLRRLLFHRAMVRAFQRRLVTSDRPDVVVCAMPTPGMCAAAVEYGKREDVPVVLDVRDLWPDLFVDLMPGWLQPLLRRMVHPIDQLNRSTFARADALVGISPGFLEWGLRQAGRPQGPADRVCHMGHRRTSMSDDELQAAKQRWSRRGVEDDGTFRCTFSGTIGHLFDLETVIAAADRHHRRGDQQIQFVICGEGAKLDHYRRLARSLPNVVFPGWVHAHDVAALHEMSSIGLAPYLQKIQTTYPNKVVDYISRGVPVIATRSGELATLVESRSVGGVYEEGDCDSFCEIVARAREDSNLRARWQANATALYEDEFDARQVYRVFIDYLQSMSNQTKELRACA